MGNVIEISNLKKMYGSKCAIDDISLDIGTGMFGLLGPNGAGKTTLMRILATTVKPTAGTITIEGCTLKSDSKTRAKIGYLPQDFTMYRNMTAYEILDYLAILSGIETKGRKELVYDTLKLVNMYKERKTRFGAMSGGMKRRIGIAQAIIHNPRVIIVDEPTAGLDIEEQIRFRHLLCELASNRAVILSTHIVADIEATCSELAVLKGGRIVYKGTIEDMCKGASIEEAYLGLMNKDA